MQCCGTSTPDATSHLNDQTHLPISNRARDTQLSDLSQHLLDPTVQVALRILLSRVRVQELLHLRHSRVRFGAEPQLDLDQRLERRIQIRHAKVDQLRQFRKELFVQGLVGGFGKVGFPLCAGQLRGVFVGLFHQLLHLGTCGVVVEELVIPFLNA